jgi:MFS family permease
MALIARKVGPHRWLSFQLLFWGSLCMAHAAIRGSGTLIALRLLLGAAESGFTQTSFYYMSLMYPKYSLGLRLGLFSGMYSVAGAFAGLLAYGLLHIESERVHGWQVVFLFEGGLTVLTAVVAFLVLPTDVATARFLTAEERAHAVARMDRDLADAQEATESGQSDNGITMRDILDVLKDWKKILSIVFNILAVLVCTYLTLTLIDVSVSVIFVLTHNANSPSPPSPPSSRSLSRAWATRASRRRSCRSPPSWLAPSA